MKAWAFVIIFHSLPAQQTHFFLIFAYIYFAHSSITLYQCLVTEIFGLIWQRLVLIKFESLMSHIASSLKCCWNKLIIFFHLCNTFLFSSHFLIYYGTKTIDFAISSQHILLGRWKASYFEEIIWTTVEEMALDALFHWEETFYC